MRNITYEKLDHNYTYGSLATDGFWDGVEEEQKAAREAERRERQRRLEQQRKSSVRFYEPLMKKAQQPFVKEADKVVPETRQSRASRIADELWLKIAGAVCGGVLFVSSLGSVILNQQIMGVQTELVALQRLETELINTNNEIRISVEQLKGPERIREIASKELGLVVARDNVYVSSVKTRTVGDYYREGTGRESNAVFAVNR